MNKKTFVGMYDTDEALLAAIEELDEKGIDPENMYVISRNEEDVELLRRRTSEDIQSVPSNWLDRFIGYISGENHVRSMLVEVGFDEADLRRYEAEIKQGKRLLYVEGEPEKSAYEINEERQKAETNPFNHPVSEAERLNREDDSPVGIGEDGLPKNEYRDSVLTDGYEGNSPAARENLLFGRAGAEALYDRSEYEPKPANLSSPSQIRGTPSKERASRRSRELEEVEQQRHDVFPDPHNFMDSQMDRQDAIAETTDFDDTSDGLNPMMDIYSEDVGRRQKQIVIDLRNINKMEADAETWLRPKNWNRD